MFDEIRVRRLYCYHCGAALEDRLWQTKSGECLMNRYNSLEEFGAEFYKLAAIRLAEICPNCEQFIEVEVSNPSDEHRNYLAQTNQRWREQIIEEQTAAHPDHRFSGYSGKGDVLYSNAWCRICKEKSYAKGRENPEMSREHKAAAVIWANQQAGARRSKQPAASPVFWSLDTIGICTRDLAASLAFYENLGFVREKDTEEGSLMSADAWPLRNPRLFIFRTDNVSAPAQRRRFDLLDNPPGIDHIRFLVDGLEAVCVQLKAKGIVVDGPSPGDREGVKVARLRDPDGNNLYFVEEPAEG